MIISFSGRDSGNISRVSVSAQTIPAAMMTSISRLTKRLKKAVLKKEWRQAARAWQVGHFFDVGRGEIAGLECRLDVHR